MTTQWYKTGTVQATNGSANLVFSGTALLANANPGQAILMDDGVHELLTVDDDTHATMQPNYTGTSGSGKSYSIVPVQGYLISLANQVAAMVNSVAAYTSLSPTAGDFLQFLGSPPVPANRSPLQALVTLTGAITEATVSSATTCDIGSATTPKVQITGTTTITSLGSVANCLRFVRFAGALTLTHNATSLILPNGGSNIATTNGDSAIFLSDNSGNWRCISYQYVGGRNSPAFTGTMTAAAASYSGNIGIGGAAYGEAGYNALSLYAAASGSELNFMRSGAVSAQLYETSSGLSIAASSSIFIRPSGGGATLTATSSLLTIGTAINYGGVTLSNSVTGTLKMVLSDSPLFTGVPRIQVATNENFRFKDLSGVVFLSISNDADSANVAFRLDASQTILGMAGNVGVGTATNGSWTGAHKFGCQSATNAASFYCSDGTNAGYNVVAIRGDTVNTLLQLYYFGTSGCGSVSFTGGGSGVAYNTTSDERLKDWMIEQADYRAAIKALWVGDFKWKANGTKAFGVRAQQAYQVMPHQMGVTKPANDDDEWHASAEPYGHLALWGVKDLYTITETQAEKIARLEGRVAELEAKVA